MEENKNGKIFLNIKSNFIKKVIFEFLEKNKFLTIIQYNKNIQNIFNINLDNYKKEAKIELDLLFNINNENEQEEFNPIQFINQIEVKNKDYYHIYFDNDCKKEIKSIYIEFEEIFDLQKIKIIIDYNVKSLCGLFKDCKNINKIKFVKFNRKDITDMSYMFYNCFNLKELDISKIYTDNVQDMRAMFFKCGSLEKLNFSKFKTDNVKDMSNMFYECSSLVELNLSNFNTQNVQYMSNMFNKCSSLVNLNVSSFNTENVIYMPDMFSECSSLKELNISNFNFSNIKLMSHMFAFCSDELKEKIKKENTHLKNEVFE